MTAWRRAPLRLRLTLLFVPGMALVLIAVAAFTVHRTNRDLLAAVDAGLRSRAEVVAADVRTHGPSLVTINSDLIESDEAFAQIADASGAVLQSSPIVATEQLLPPPSAQALRGPTLFERQIRGIDGTTRLLAVPVIDSDGRWIVVVGASLQDRRDQVVDLTRTFALVLPIGLLLVAAAGWALIGGTLRPVERMRAQAASIATTDLQGRLTPGLANDEITRLGTTLNELLDRVQTSIERERRIVDDASHELRTPLSILRTELELALAQPRTAAELESALRSAAEETDHLVRLANDLLVLARARSGDLPLRLERVPLGSFLDEAAARHRSRSSATITVRVSDPDGEICADVSRMRQVLDNLLDNAIRHTPAGGRVDISGEVGARGAEVTVRDSGGGFAADTLDHAFEPFTRGADQDGHGLGLAIVKAIVDAHGGRVTATNDATGARVVMMLPHRELEAASSSLH